MFEIEHARWIAMKYRQGSLASDLCVAIDVLALMRIRVHWLYYCETSKVLNLAVRSHACMARSVSKEDNSKQSFAISFRPTHRQTLIWNLLIQTM